MTTTMARIFWGILFVAAGTLVTLYGDKIYETFGEASWIERYMSSRFFYKLLGIIAAFAGFLIITNLHKSLILWVVGLFLPQVRQ